MKLKDKISQLLCETYEADGVNDNGVAEMIVEIVIKHIEEFWK